MTFCTFLIPVVLPIFEMSSSDHSVSTSIAILHEYPPLILLGKLTVFYRHAIIQSWLMPLLLHFSSLWDLAHSSMCSRSVNWDESRYCQYCLRLVPFKCYERHFFMLHLLLSNNFTCVLSCK